MRRGLGPCLCAIAAVAALATAPPARADQPAPDDGAESPWSRGVSAADRARAQELLERGNALFLESKHREALAIYRQAIEAWDHPAIRFNVVRALIQLDKPLEAFENLEKALAYGAAPLEPTVFAEAQSYRRLLLGQIAEIEIRCTQEGAAVTVDGEPFLTCPGARKARVRPGSHAVVGRKADHLTTTRDLVALPGKTVAVDLELVSIADATVTERRLPNWQPWAVAGSGVAVAGIGLLFYLQGNASIDQFEDEVAACGPSGCAPGALAQSTLDLESRGKLYSRIGVGTMVAGGVLSAAGIGLVIWNRPRPVIPERPTVAPAVGGDRVGVVISGRF